MDTTVTQPRVGDYVKIRKDFYNLGFAGKVFRIKSFVSNGVYIDSDTNPSVGRFYQRDEVELLGSFNDMMGKAIEKMQEEVKAEAKSALDVQVGGDHYKDKGIQPVEYIKANGLCFFRGNVLKYITRTKNPIEDLKKARHYLDMLIEFEEKK